MRLRKGDGAGSKRCGSGFGFEPAESSGHERTRNSALGLKAVFFQPRARNSLMSQKSS